MILENEGLFIDCVPQPEHLLYFIFGLIFREKPVLEINGHKINRFSIKGYEPTIPGIRKHPDIIARLVVDSKPIEEDVLVEFKLKSRDFLKDDGRNLFHLLVCWEHDSRNVEKYLKGIPGFSGVKVLSLKKIVENNPALRKRFLGSLDLPMIQTTREHQENLKERLNGTLKHNTNFKETFEFVQQLEKKHPLNFSVKEGGEGASQATVRCFLREPSETEILRFFIPPPQKKNDHVRIECGGILKGLVHSTDLLNRKAKNPLLHGLDTKKPDQFHGLIQKAVELSNK